MRYLTLIILCLTLSSCGKSPLLNKFKAPLTAVSGGARLSRVEFSFLWKVPPSVEELGEFEIELKNPLPDNVTVHAYLWMPDMGHGSSPIEIKKISSTNYLFTEVAFIMTGLWVLHVEFLEKDKVVDKWEKSIVL